jgi:hypothetical protein
MIRYYATICIASYGVTYLPTTEAIIRNQAAADRSATLHRLLLLLLL